MSAAAEDALDTLAARTLEVAVVARGLEARSEQSARAVERAAQEVGAAAARLSAVGEQIGRDAVRVIGTEAAAHVRGAAAESLADLRTRLDSHAQRLQGLDAAIAASTTALTRAQRRWLLIAPATLVVGCALAIVGTAAWVAAARTEVARLRADAATLQALARSEVVRCGDALCARVERDGSAPAGYRRITKRVAVP